MTNSTYLRRTDRTTLSALTKIRSHKPSFLGDASLPSVVYRIGTLLLAAQLSIVRPQIAGRDGACL